MKSPDWSNCTEEDLWKFVAWHLSKEGIESTLVGGSVVSIYSQGAYRSGDLDFIISDSDREKIDQILLRLGFKKEGRHFVHPDCHHLFVEFPPGPLAIGSDYKIIPAKMIHQKQVLRILSPTDCVCDRLASFIHFKTRDSLDQAVLVACSNTIDLDRIKKWCRKDNGLEQYREFLALLKKSLNETGKD